MRLIIVIAAVVGVALVTAFFAPAAFIEGATNERVAAGFYPLAYAAEELEGKRSTVEDLTPPGAEPHDLELTPEVVRKVKSAHVVLLLGHGFQPQLERAVAGRPNVVRVLDTPGLRRMGNDPHVWLDPLRYAVLVRRLGRVLGANARASRLVTRLRSLDRAYRAGLAPCERREIVTTHEAFAYLAERYGLRQVPIMGLSPEAEPTPDQIGRSVAVIRRTGARVVYREPLVSPKVADTVAHEAGASTAVLDPIEALTPAELARGEDYFSVMRSNLAALRKGLRCR